MNRNLVWKQVGHGVPKGRKYRIGLVKNPCSELQGGKVQGRLTQLATSATVVDISGDKALVADGLRVGEIVASQGVAFLHEGQAVTRIGVGPRQFNE